MNEVINFWFSELTPEDWWKKSDELDKLIERRFLKIHQAAARCELSNWRNSSEGRLAEIIVLDQFSRNIYRGKPESFSYDGLALILAQEAICSGADKLLSPEKKAFMYMPYMHSESAVIHEEAVRLFSQKGLEGNLDFEHAHYNIIKKFGRYPHRNEILGRQSTQEEIDFLKGPNSSF